MEKIVEGSPCGVSVERMFRIMIRMALIITSRTYHQSAKREEEVDESTDEAADVPASQHGEQKQRREAGAVTLVGAETIAKAQGNTPNPQEVTSGYESDMQVGVSPSKATEIRMRNLEHLRGLYIDIILSNKEVAELEVSRETQKMLHNTINIIAVYHIFLSHLSNI